VLCLWSGVRPLKVGVLRKRIDRTGTLAASRFDVSYYLYVFDYLLEVSECSHACLSYLGVGNIITCHIVFHVCVSVRGSK